MFQLSSIGVGSSLDDGAGGVAAVAACCTSTPWTFPAMSYHGTTACAAIQAPGGARVPDRQYTGSNRFTTQQRKNVHTQSLKHRRTNYTTTYTQATQTILTCRGSKTNCKTTIAIGGTSCARNRPCSTWHGPANTFNRDTRIRSGTKIRSGSRGVPTYRNGRCMPGRREPTQGNDACCRRLGSPEQQKQESNEWMTE